MARRAIDGALGRRGARGPAVTIVGTYRTPVGDRVVAVRLRGGRRFTVRFGRAVTDDDVAALVERIAADWPGRPMRLIDDERGSDG